MKYKKVLFTIIAILCVIAISFGVLQMFKKDSEKNPANKDHSIFEKVDINNQLITMLYNEVKGCYSKELGKNTNYYFLENSRVTLDSISNEQKMYCGMQFLNPTDFTKLSNSEYNMPRYSLSANKFLQAIQHFFGPNANYEKVDLDRVIVFANSFPDNGGANFKYNNDSYTITLVGVGGANSPLKEVYRSLISARKNDEYIELKERFIVTSISVNEDQYNPKNFSIYKDFNQTNLIKQFTNISIEELEHFDSNGYNQYLSQGSTVTYTFKKGSNDNYYFYSSKVE